MASASAPPARRSMKRTLRVIELPKPDNAATFSVSGKTVQLTNLNKPFWPEEGIIKRDLIQYYADVSSVLLPHLRDRAMVMKRYPGGAHSEPFFQKRAPDPRPGWIRICNIEHDS